MAQVVNVNLISLGLSCRNKRGGEPDVNRAAFERLPSVFVSEEADSGRLTECQK